MKLKIKDMVLIAAFCAIIAICSWIVIPFAQIPITMQIFGIYLSLMVFGDKRGVTCVIVYIALGVIGLPVFANFKAGLSAISGATGGYIIGFIPMALIYNFLCGFIKLPFQKRAFICGIISLMVCYTFGSLWFWMVYSKANGTMALMSIILTCVVPYIIPDILKLYVAIKAAKLIKRANVV